MTRRILLIAYAFPPVSAPEALLAAKTLGSLPGYQVDVICSAPSANFIGSDHSLDAYVEKRFGKVTRLPLPLWLQKLSSSKKLARLFFGLSLFPDRAVYLNQAAFKTAIKFEPESYDLILTWSQFHSAHLVGTALKRKYPKLPWVAHFSDPWVDNPFNRLKWLTTPSYRRDEKEVVTLADRIIFTSPLTIELVMKKYPSSYLAKVCVVPHPFDPELYRAAPSDVKPTIVFRYLGRFYGPRNPETLLQALELLEKNRPEILSKIRIEFVGGGYKQLGKFSKAVQSVVKEIPSVDYLTSLELMQSADVLLVIDAPADITVFLPSKLVDYLGTGKPIIGITPPGTSAELINQLGGRCASPTDPKAIEKLLIETVETGTVQRGNRLIEARYAQVQQEFSVTSISTQMSFLLEDVIKSSVRTTK